MKPNLIGRLVLGRKNCKICGSLVSLMSVLKVFGMKDLDRISLNKKIKLTFMNAGLNNVLLLVF